MRTNLIPGVNVDLVDVNAGLLEFDKLGYDSQETRMVVEYALVCWARGEEADAQRRATDLQFYGISLTCWYRVLAAALAANNQGEENGKV